MAAWSVCALGFRFGDLGEPEQVLNGMMLTPDGATVSVSMGWTGGVWARLGIEDHKHHTEHVM